MRAYKLVAVFLAVTVVGFLYDKYNSKRMREKHIDQYDIVRRHLLGVETLHLEPHKPTIWMHIAYETNDRTWTSFHSRNSRAVNLPYAMCAMASLVRHCSGDFNVCFLNDESFKHVIPHWEVDVSRLSGETQALARTLAMTKILHKYGGMCVPFGALVTRSLLPLYDEMTSSPGADMFACELETSHLRSHGLHTFVSHKCMGCLPRSKAMKELSSEVEILMSNDYTSASVFEGTLDKQLHRLVTEGRVRVVGGRAVGKVDANDEVVTLDRLFERTAVPFDFEQLVMVYVDLEALKRRRKYDWFLHASADELLGSGIVLTEMMRFERA
jgi:hypothetical protein